jgi:tetratricopeptide (TPR) repeat protein
MPSHIFIALGMWDDVISANINSIKVADDRIKAKGLKPDARNYHALMWLEYGYLQENRVADAERVLADAAQSGGRIGQMRAILVVETGSWDKLGDIKTTGPMLASVEMLTARGMVEIHKGQTDAARKSLAEAQAKLGDGGGASYGMAGQMAGMPMAASPNDHKSAEIMVHELGALLLRADGKKDAALKMLADAAAAEDAMTFEYGPPVPVKPVHELYGEVLLADGNFKDAQKQFQKALERCPKRRLALQGLARAEQGMKPPE